MTMITLPTAPSPNAVTPMMLEALPDALVH